MQIKIKRYRHSLFIQLLLECFALQKHLVKVTSPVTSSLFALLLVMRLGVPQCGSALFSHLGNSVVLASRLKSNRLSFN